MLGFDVERRLWDVVAEEACRLDQGSEKCKRVRAYVREVFGWMDSVPRPW
jgi:alpha 1,2-mannosyltransferase